MVVLVIAAIVAGAAVLGVALVRSRSAGCTLAPPAPVLPAQLRIIGEFDRPYDTGDPRALMEAAARAATGLHADLAGVAPADPVAVHATSASMHDAVVVPLRVTGAAPSGPGAAGSRVEGLVAFLLDCSGRAYYSATEDLLRESAPLPTSFPAVDHDAAVRALGGDAVLVYTDSPFAPFWRDAATGRTTPAT